MTADHPPRGRFASLMFLTAAAAAVAFAPVPLPASAPRHITRRIEAAQYAFTPSQINVHPGDTVTLELVSTDVVHGLYIDRYDIGVEADPGQTARLTFVADRAGSFRMRCNVTCGQYHPFMIGRITVGTPIALWRAAGLALITLAAVFLGTKPSKPREDF